jgi:hypothetical protein
VVEAFSGDCNLAQEMSDAHVERFEAVERETRLVHMLSNVQRYGEGVLKYARSLVTIEIMFVREFVDCEDLGRSI